MKLFKRKKPESTSSKVAKIAAKGLNNPELLTLKEIKSVCASVLTQKENKPKKKCKHVVSSRADGFGYRDCSKCDKRIKD